MFIAHIKKFLPKYENINKADFINILNWANITWFDIYKLEKDFLLTLILIKFWKKYKDLVFKWWTCLNKIYFPYFRLSEDLDFVADFKWWERARKTLLKNYENSFINDLWNLWLTIKEWRTRFDSYRLAMFVFKYKSIIDNSIQTVKIDLSIKGSLQLKPVIWEIKSIYIDKVYEENIFWKHTINCIDLNESTAEKIRASLTRKTPAIRDFFDIWYIKNNSNFDFNNDIFKKIVDIKLKEVNYEYSLDWNYVLLEKQIKSDLLPVLDKNHKFNFDEIYNFILEFKK